MPNWSTPKIVQEKVIIEPEVLLNDAHKFKEAGDYQKAERILVNAVSNAAHTDKETAVKQTVRDELCDIYSIWGTYCIHELYLQEAEDVMLKKIRISKYKAVTEKKLMEMYGDWSALLVSCDNNYTGGLILDVKCARLQLKYKDINGLASTVGSICKNMLSRNNPYNADSKRKENIKKLYIKTTGNEVFKKAIRTALAALIFPILISFFITNFVARVVCFAILSLWFTFSAIQDPLFRLGKSSIISFLAVIWIIPMIVFANRFNVNIVIVTYFLTIIQCIRLLLLALRRFRVYYQYSGTEDRLAQMIEKIIPRKTVQCKKCQWKKSIPGYNTEQIKCPKCGEVVRNKIDLSIVHRELIKKKV